MINYIKISEKEVYQALINVNLTLYYRILLFRKTLLYVI